MAMGQLQFIDTHCHIHSSDYPLDQDAVIATAMNAGVTAMLCVGTDIDDSEQAAAFVANRSNTWATAGIHPHEASRYVDQPEVLAHFTSVAKRPKVVAIGECGLDYFYNHSPKQDQIKLLRFQIETALELDIPLVFHVRDAFDDFWPIFEQYDGLRGVVHSYTANGDVLHEVLSHGLYVGLNGITTFMKPGEQLEAIKAVPLDRMLLETDAPFLTPVPFRGTMNEPKYIPHIAEYIADLRGEDKAAIARATTANANKLFKLELMDESAANAGD